MIAVQHRGFFFEKRHQHFRLGVAGIAARHEHGIHARQLAKHFAPFFKRGRNGFRVGIIPVHRRIPDPHVESVLVRQARHLGHHAHRRQRKVRAVRRVIRARRNQLDGVGPKHGQIADVLLPHRHGPAVVRVGFRPVTELVSAQRISGRARFAPAVRDAHSAALQPHLAQQTSDPEKHPAVVVPPDTHRIARDLDVVPLGRPGPLIRHLDAHSRRRWRDRPPDAGPLLYLIHQHRNGFLFRTAEF